jgi:ABC-type multidrug transport system ATPase subunit
MGIEFRAVYKSFEKEKSVLTNINFKVHKDSCVAILGKNGSGKTTILNILADLVTIDSGIILRNNENIKNRLLEFKHLSGFHLDQNILIKEFTGIHFLKFISAAYGLKENVEKNISDITEYFFENKEDLHRKIGEYSTGMKQKILFCSAVLSRPHYLILDEPFSGLDLISANRLIKFLNQYRKENIIIVTSHDLSYVEKIATQIVVLDEGAIKFEGNITDFKEKGQLVIEDALFKYIQPKEYSISLEELSWFFDSKKND